MHVENVVQSTTRTSRRNSIQVDRIEYPRQQQQRNITFDIQRNINLEHFGILSKFSFTFCRLIPESLTINTDDERAEVVEMLGRMKSTVIDDINATLRTSRFSSKLGKTVKKGMKLSSTQYVTLEIAVAAMKPKFTQIFIQRLCTMFDITSKKEADHVIFFTLVILSNTMVAERFADGKMNSTRL